MTTFSIKITDVFFEQNPDLIPKHGKFGDAGLDVRSMEDFVLHPGEFHKFPLGIAIELQEQTFARIEGRSGNASNFGIDTIGNIIDSNYRGEINAILVNNGKQDFIVKKGDRIAQMIIQPYIISILQPVNELSSSERGEFGFGSTGTK